MVPIKFRCYRCNQLLGVSPSKIGAVVACPKCAADLVVPDPDESDLHMLPDASTVTDPPREPEPRSGSLDQGVAFNVLDIRPQDIRVEPGVYQATRQSTAPSPEFTQATVVPTGPYTTTIVPSPSFDVPPPVTRQPAVDPPAPPPSPAPAAIAPTVRIEAPRTVPAIKIDEPTTTSTRPSPVVVRSRDLVLPRSVVASWSLFVLLALMFAFLTGLLAGHYVWRVHEPVRRLGLGPRSRLAWVQDDRRLAPFLSPEWPMRG